MIATKFISDYFKNEIKLAFRIIGLKNIEVDKNGTKAKMNSGSFEVKITGNLLKDRESRWENSPVNKFLRGVYDRYIIEGRIKKYEQNVFDDVNTLLEQVKDFFVIEGMK